MKILYVTTVAGTMNFFDSYISMLIKKGHVVEIATNDKISKLPEKYNELGCKIHTINFSRNPLNKNNLLALKELKRVIAEGKFDIVHCHTPVAAMCTRLACRKVRKTKTRVIYTAHGFHFYKGAPLKNWALYFPVEWICAWMTDVLITINKEDYMFAKKHLHAKEIQYIPGVGIDVDRIQAQGVDRKAKRLELEIPEDALLLLSIGELNQNKNHELVLNAIKDMNVYYVIAGNGALREHLESVASKLGISNRVKLLGHRKDVIALCKTADIFVFPSHREGLPVSIMEAMASGLPIVCSKIRGNVDIVDEAGGLFFDSTDVNSCSCAIERLMKLDIKEMGKYNTWSVLNYSLEKINDELLRIYYS